MQVRPAVAVLRELHSADRGHVLDRVRDRDDELAHLGCEVARQRGQVMVLDRHEHEHDGQPGVT